MTKERKTKEATWRKCSAKGEIRGRDGEAREEILKVE